MSVSIGLRRTVPPPLRSTAHDVVEPHRDEGDENKAQQQRHVHALAGDARVADLHAPAGPSVGIDRVHRRCADGTCCKPAAQVLQSRLTLPCSSTAGRRLAAQHDIETPVAAVLALEPFVELVLTFWL
jgi:hypothetical protein